MNPTIKQEWVKRLRSGDYKQGRVWLLKIKDDGASEYCCLGVLSEIWWEETSPEAHRDIDYGSCWIVATENGYSKSATLPQVVVEWAGLEDSFGRLPSGVTLTDLNDRGVPFTEIADIIEAEL